MMPGISAIKPKQDKPLPVMIATSKNRFRSRALAQAAAATPALAVISTAQAQTIVWSGVLDQSVATDGVFVQIAPLDFNQNSSTEDFEAYVFGQTFKGDNNLHFTGNTSAKSDPNAFLYRDEPVALGTLIDSSLSGIVSEAHIGLYHSSNGSNPLNPGESKYYAFVQSDGGQAHYGWVQVSLSADGLTGTLNQWAYNSTAGESILAGQTSAVPEPSTYGVMCGIALAGWAVARRRRGNRSIA
jgi:hypothetical protein